MRFALQPRVEFVRRMPERAERPVATGVIPHAGRDDTVTARDAAHLLQPADGVGHEVDDELGERRIECRGPRGQLLCRPRWMSTPGLRTRAAATKLSDGSTAETASGPRRSTSSAVRAPGPQPTSSTRWPPDTPARSASCGASGAEYLPMNRSYASASTSKLIARSLRREARASAGPLVERQPQPSLLSWPRSAPPGYFALWTFT